MNDIMQKDLNEARQLLSETFIEVTEDSIVACGNIDSTDGNYLWALELIVQESINGTNWKILHLGADNRVLGENKIWTTLTLKAKNEADEFFLTEEEAAMLQKRIDTLIEQ